MSLRAKRSNFHKEISKKVIPAKAGIQNSLKDLDSCFRRNDTQTPITTHHHKKRVEYDTIPFNLSSINTAARALLRSDAVTRIHLSKYSKSLAPQKSAMEILAGLQNTKACCAYFTHEGASAIATTGENILISPNDSSQRIRQLIETLPLKEFVGEPFDKAMSFIVNNESHHRTFYGGVVGLIDPSRFIFRPVNHTLNFTDGAVEGISGMDMAAG